MNREEVLKLAKLARIEIGDAEAEKLSHEFEKILGYVGEVKGISGETGPLAAGEVNKMRDDAHPHESGIYTEKLLEEAPSREGDYVKVKKIL